MESFCQCGAMASYPHKSNCPFPYFGNDLKMVGKWIKGKKEKEGHQENCEFCPHAYYFDCPHPEGCPQI